MMLTDCVHQHQANHQQQVTMLSPASNVNQRTSGVMPMRQQHQQQQPQHQQHSNSHNNNCHQVIHNQHMQQQQQQPPHYVHQDQTHYIDANQNPNHQPHQHNQHTHDQRSQQQPPNSYNSQHQVYTNRPMSQHQQLGQSIQGQHQQLPVNVVHAPPTPPSDDHLQQTVYLAPQDNRQQLHSNRLQTGAWVMQTVQIHQQQQQQQQHQDQNELQDAATGPQQQQTTISNYYYDIDDGFSDILSAPASPEPVQMINQQQQLNDSYQHDYNNYLPYNTNDTNNHQHHHQMVVGKNVQLDFESTHNHYSQQHHHNHHHQQQQQHFYQTQVQGACHQTAAPVPYMAAMSPDSSSLSTTSSSPSDHSLYQGSPPMTSCPIGRGQASQTVSVQPVADQLKHHHYQSHSLPLSPPAKSPMVSTNKQQQIFSISQQQANSPNTSSQVILKPINNGGQSVRQQEQPMTQTQPQQANHHVHTRSSPIHLWEFLKELLQQVEAGSADATIIRWLDRQRGVFKIEDSVRVAKLWGKRKNKPRMNYDKLSRSIRQYYKKGIMKKTDRSQRLVYQFCSAYCH